MTKLAIVTGGAGSVGPHVGEGLKKDGFDVVLTDINPRVIEIAEGIGAKGVVGDVTSLESMRQVMAPYDRIDAIVTTHGAWPINTIDELTVEKWNFEIALNLTAAFIVTKAALAGLRAAKGSIVHFASSCALQGYANMIPYGAAKAGVIGLTRQLAVSLGPDGINANCIIPGGMATASNMTPDGGWPDWMDVMVNSRAIPRLGYAKDLVGAACFFVSPGAKFITGQSLIVDGGYLFQ